MPAGVLLDNDVVLKACAWRLSDALLQATSGAGPPACLGVARHSMRSRLDRWRSLRDRDAARLVFEDLLGRVEWTEPTADEIGIAAGLEELALRAGHELDGGESQLAAIAIARGSPLLVTGDKRAIVALGAVAAGRVDGRVACLEQFLATACAMLGANRVRDLVCADAPVDRSAAIAFACGGAHEDPLPALSSYVRHLRAASAALAAGDVLPAVVAKEDGVGRA